MKTLLNILALTVYSMPASLWAAETAAVSPTGGVLKMILGLALVLAVMALVTWGLKRMMPGAGGQQSAVRIVGGVSVGSRERVVVLEVAGRWLVVGVAPGQVSAIANLDIGSSAVTNNAAEGDYQAASAQTLAPSFAQWLKQSATKFSERNDAK